MRPVHITLAAAVLAAMILGGCNRTPEWPVVRGDGWRTYTQGALGFTMKYPAVCRYEEYESGTIFRANGPIIAVSLLGAEEARRRGLWASHDPTGEVELGGRAGQKYVYDHYDGPFGMHTVSYVVPHRGRWLALEFRMEGDTPGPLQSEIIDSFGLQ